MKVLRQARRLVRAGGCAALALGMAGAAGAVSAPAQARVTAILVKSSVAAGWGYNAQGQLGDGTITSRSGYGDIRVGNDVVQVAAGSGHGLALRSDGTVWAWGFNGSGELGDGTRTSRSTPVQVTGLTGVTQVAASGAFSLALRSDGTVWAWGDNRAGQLGHGTTSNHEVTPARVTGGFATVLGTDGTVWAWGDDSAGQLGNARSSIPVTRPLNTIGAGSGITQLSAGDFHVLALKSNGTALAWGSNGSGQLGNGSTTDPAGPVLVTGLANATQVAAGERFSLAVHTVPYLLGS
jgi:alpha-tubulin suppressor-like RCC1 family protein